MKKIRIVIAMVMVIAVAGAFGFGNTVSEAAYAKTKTTVHKTYKANKQKDKKTTKKSVKKSTKKKPAKKHKKSKAKPKKTQTKPKKNQTKPKTAVHTHKWEPVYSTRDVEKTRQVAWTKCYCCGADMTGHPEHIDQHLLNHESNVHYGTEYRTETYYVPEKYISGYRCSCGATK